MFNSQRVWRKKRIHKIQNFPRPMESYNGLSWSSYLPQLLHAPFADKASCFRATPKRWAHKRYRSIPLELPFYWENDDKSWGLGCQSFRQPHLISVGIIWYQMDLFIWYHMIVRYCKMVPNLVGGLEHEFYLSINIGNVIIPTDFNSIIFQRGRAQPPTR